MFVKNPNVRCLPLTGQPDVMEFSLNVPPNSVTKIFVITVKGLEPVTSCVRDQDASNANKTHVRDRIFKLSTIHALVIFRFTEFNESSALFRKNSSEQASWTKVII